MFAKIFRIIRHINAKIYVKRYERVHKDIVRYMYIDKGYDRLLIVFSGFTGKERRYNYFTSLKKIKMNQLYVLDTWGYLGSYYWYEQGRDVPEKLVSDLILTISKEKNIKILYTAGSSKGGTAAIYFGLKHNAKEIYAGACQYYVGTYLARPEQKEILLGMMNSESDEAVQVLDDKLRNLLKEKTHNCVSHINLFYSNKELTYERQIIPLKTALEGFDYDYSERIEEFENHDEVGKYFPGYLISKLEEALKNEHENYKCPTLNR